ncbi:MAG: GGDEF domain-containing protein [Gammaproteobacteria bacterium]|nr:GGDEF domain-containing protein [Gammaproteobacteria bacterium]
MKNYLILILIAAEVLGITYLDYLVRNTFFSLDVLYCLPVIQAARLGAIHAMRRSDSQHPTFVAIAVALAWSLAEVAIIWPEFPWQALAMNLFTRSVTFTVIGRVVTKLWKEREFAFKDSLTQLANRYDFFDRFEIEQERSERSGSPYSLLYIDVDNFKALNDERGHQTGDAALQALASVLRENSRRVDIVSRFGGDEFVMVFPDTDEPTCLELVKRIQHAADTAFRRRGWPISLSVGHVTETGYRLNANDILREADMRMYTHKKGKQ